MLATLALGAALGAGARILVAQAVALAAVAAFVLSRPASPGDRRPPR